MKKSNTGEFKFAFINSLPILFSYIFLGMAFGIMMTEAGYGPGWSFITSFWVYTGAFQMALAGFLKAGAPILTILFTALAMGSRHIFYGVSFLEDFPKYGKKYPFMIFSLTDESYALYCSLKIPEELDHKKVRFYIGFLIWWYWIGGSVMGGLIGTLVPFDFKGIDFVMTAMFVCVFIDQWRGEKRHIPALAGLICSIAFLLVVGKDNFILPALVVATGIILATAPKKAKTKEEKA